MREDYSHSNLRYKKFAIGLAIATATFIFVTYLLITSQIPTIMKISLPAASASENIQVEKDRKDALKIRNFYSLDQKDNQLIQYTRRYLTPPSKLPYNLREAGNFKDEFSRWIANFFKNKKNGVFIEAGANEGDRGSHTLYLEKELGWTGLLIECNPKVVPTLKTRHRKAWIAEVCLAPSTTPGVLNFSNPINWTYSGTMKKPWNLPVESKWEIFEVQTIPLYTVLAALGWIEVDYFSFDIEGVELSVLKTFPFNLFIFKVLIIEIFFYTAEEKKELNDLLISNGYIFVRDIDIDKIYIHNSVKDRLK